MAFQPQSQPNLQSQSQQYQYSHSHPSHPSSQQQPQHQPYPSPQQQRQTQPEKNGIQIIQHSWYKKMAHFALDNGTCVRCEMNELLFQDNFIGLLIRYRDPINHVGKRRYVSIIFIAALHYIWCSNKTPGRVFYSDEEEESQFHKTSINGVLPLLLIHEQDVLKLSEFQRNVFAWQVRQTSLLLKYLYKSLPHTIQIGIEECIKLKNSLYRKEHQHPPTPNPSQKIITSSSSSTTQELGKEEDDDEKLNENELLLLEQSLGVTIAEHSWWQRFAHVKVMDGKTYRAQIHEIIMQPPLIGVQMRYYVNGEEEFERFSPIFLYAQHYAWFNGDTMSEPEDETEFRTKKIKSNLPLLRLSDQVQSKLSSLEQNSFSWEGKQIDVLHQVLLNMQAEAMS